MPRRRFVAALLAGLWLSTATPAFAQDEQVSVAQASDGTIVVTLSGARSACSIAFAGSPTISVSGPNYTITSVVVLPGCPPPPPPVPAPTPYSIAANIGLVPDGSHTVTWLFTGAMTGAFATSFSIANGTLQPAPVPALTPMGYAALALLLLFSAYLLRLRPS